MNHRRERREHRKTLDALKRKNIITTSDTWFTTGLDEANCGIFNPPRHDGIRRTAYLAGVSEFNRQHQSTNEKK